VEADPLVSHITKITDSDRILRCSQKLHLVTLGSRIVFERLGMLVGFAGGKRTLGRQVLISMWPILHHCREYDTNEVFQLPIFLSCSGEPVSPGVETDAFSFLGLIFCYLTYSSERACAVLEVYPSLTQGLSSVKTCYFATSTREALPRARNELSCGRLSSKTFLDAAAHMAVSCYG
jgi:hypothetical protein